MKNISNAIEQFIIDTLGDSASVVISRNQLALYFNCVPSQINYVLTTRFTTDKGYVVDSKRGGGGYIEITKLSCDNIVNDLLNFSITSQLTFARSSHILCRLVTEKIITDREKELVEQLISDKALATPNIELSDRLRANIFKSYLVYLLRS